MDHQAQAQIQGNSQTTGKIGVHMSAAVSIVVPASASFGPPPRELKVDHTKVTVVKKG